MLTGTSRQILLCLLGLLAFFVVIDYDYFQMIMSQGCEELIDFLLGVIVVRRDAYSLDPTGNCNVQ